MSVQPDATPVRPSRRGNDAVAALFDEVGYKALSVAAVAANGLLHPA